MKNKEYLEERRIIFQVLNLLGNKIGIVYIIIAFALSVIHLLVAVLPSPNGGEGVFYSPAVTLFFMMTGIPLALAGTTTFGGKPVPAENLGIKGAQNQLGAFLCMPIKKESVYRLQFEAMIVCVLSISISFIGSSVNNIKAGLGFFLPNVITVVLAYCCFTVLFMLVYTPVFVTYKKRKLINVVYVVSVLLYTIYFVCLIFYNVFLSTDNNYPELFEAGGTAGNCFIIAFAVLYPLGLYAVYKNIILKKKGAGWYE